MVSINLIFCMYCAPLVDSYVECYFTLHDTIAPTIIISSIIAEQVITLRQEQFQLDFYVLYIHQKGTSNNKTESWYSCSNWSKNTGILPEWPIWFVRGEIDTIISVSTYIKS